MGERIEFTSSASKAGGYLASATSGHGPGVVVVQEWWGLVPQIERVADRLAAEGFTALAPDLYHGEIAEHTEMDKAGHLMSTLPIARAVDDMQAAVAYLLAHPATTGTSVGVIGFCMGGMLALRLAAAGGASIGAAVPYYGAPLGDDSIDWSTLRAPVLGHFAERDDFFGPEPVRALEAQLRASGHEVEFRIHPGTGHGFTNEENPLGNWDPAATAVAWDATIAFLHEHLG